MAPESSMENQAQVTTPNMANRQSPVARESSEVRSGIDTRSGIPVPGVRSEMLARVYP